MTKISVIEWDLEAPKVRFRSKSFEVRDMPRFSGREEKAVSEGFKLIPLTKGEWAIMSLEDFEWLNQWNWCAAKRKSVGFTAVRRGRDQDGKLCFIYMHRQVLRENKQQVDHINLDPLDNRRSNLRAASNTQNNFNKGMGSRNRTGLKGVGVQSRTLSKPFRVQIKAGGRRFHVGYFQSKEEAHDAYVMAARKYHGEFSRV